MDGRVESSQEGYRTPTKDLELWKRQKNAAVERRDTLKTIDLGFEVEVEAETIGSNVDGKKEKNDQEGPLTIASDVECASI